MVQFVLGRVVQGLSAGLLITAVYVVIGEVYPEALRPKLFAAISTAWVVPSLVGPIVSGCGDPAPELAVGVPRAAAVRGCSAAR